MRKNYYHRDSRKLAQRIRSCLFLAPWFATFGIASLFGSAGGTVAVGQVVMLAVAAILFTCAAYWYVQIWRRERLAIAAESKPQPRPRTRPRPQAAETAAKVAAKVPANVQPTPATSPADEVSWAEWVDDALTAAAPEPAKRAPAVALAPVELPTLTPAPSTTAVAAAAKGATTQAATKKGRGRFWDRASGTAVRQDREPEPVGAATE